mmetsp:Transcript_31089/g.61556  ORF Transcript_31089/g.61556 Transcript_31089/m.61556 type:complete len:243 (-) Transcript_31089:185-913(-)
MRLVARQPQHHQVRVLPVHAVPRVRPVPRPALPLADVLHDLVLPLPRHLLPAEHHLQLRPRRIRRHLLPDEILDRGRHPPHEIRAGGDAVRIERRPLLLSYLFPRRARRRLLLCQRLRQIPRAAEPTGPLLVQFGAGGHTVHGHVHAHFRTHDLGHDAVEVRDDARHHLALTQGGGHVHARGVGAPVDDAVHVQVQVVEFGEEGAGGQDLVDVRVPLRQPAVELGDAHVCVFFFERKCAGGK